VIDRREGDRRRPSDRSWLRQLWTEFGMRMEVRGWVVWYLIVEKAVQGLFFMFLGVWLITQRHRVPAEVRSLIEYLDLDEARGFSLARAAYGALVNIAGFSGPRVVVIGIGAMTHATLELVESLGLLLRRRWAEYLVVLATGFLIPLEVYEAILHPTLFKAAVLVVNVAVVVYLVRQKRLFQFETDVPPERR
jgi:uncharacterized membrane protein (DUF2068 family)